MAGLGYLKAGGLARELPELTARVSASAVYAALREDIGFIAEAVAPEQEAALAGRDPRSPPRTGWLESDETLRRQLHEEAQAALERRRDVRPRWGD
jgi:hypothetical protein